MSTRDDIISIIKDPSRVTVDALVRYAEAQRADERERIADKVAALDLVPGWGERLARRGGHMSDDIRDDVLSLPVPYSLHDGDCDGGGNGYRTCDCGGAALVRRSDVVSLAESWDHVIRAEVRERIAREVVALRSPAPAQFDDGEDQLIWRSEVLAAIAREDT